MAPGPLRLAISRAAIRRLVDAGFVAPGRDPRNRYRFSFQDLVILRTDTDAQPVGDRDRCIGRNRAEREAEYRPRCTGRPTDEHAVDARGALDIAKTVRHAIGKRHVRHHERHWITDLHCVADRLADLRFESIGALGHEQPRAVDRIHRDVVVDHVAHAGREVECQEVCRRRADRGRSRLRLHRIGADTTRRRESARRRRDRHRGRRIVWRRGRERVGAGRGTASEQELIGAARTSDHRCARAARRVAAAHEHRGRIESGRPAKGDRRTIDGSSPGRVVHDAARIDRQTLIE